jgi:hypothetical protein
MRISAGHRFVLGFILLATGACCILSLGRYEPNWASRWRLTALQAACDV